MKVFFTNYHISVNDCFVDDVASLGHEVIMPTISFAKDRLGFFAPNNQHAGKKNVSLIDYDQFLKIPEKIVLVFNCSQLYDDMMRLYHARGDRDQIVLLSSQLGLGEWIAAKPDWPGTDFEITHSLIWHRKTPAKYKILYFSKPLILMQPKTDEEIKLCFDNKRIGLYINHFETKRNFMEEGNFSNELKAALEFSEKWESNYGYRIPFYGAENLDGYLSMAQVQANMRSCMFTLVFKGHETWGQMVNESMLLGTPGIFMNRFIVDMFTEYLITEDTAVLGNTVDELIKKIQSMQFENYLTLVREAESMSKMFTNDSVRREKLGWLLSKVQL